MYMYMSSDMHMHMHVNPYVQMGVHIFEYIRMYL